MTAINTQTMPTILQAFQYLDTLQDKGLNRKNYVQHLQDKYDEVNPFEASKFYNLWTINPTAKDFYIQLHTAGKIPVIEIPVINKETKQQEYLLCTVEVEIEENQLYATHDSLSKQEEFSEYVPTTCIDIDDCFSLDETLQELHSKLIERIINSEYYELSE